MESPRHTRSPIVALDLMRAAAALIVFIGHVRNVSFVEYGLLPAEDRGLSSIIFFGVTRMTREAVLVFFVLSGFLVGGQVIRRIRESRFDVADYAIDRSSRILLPLVPACLLTTLLGLFVFGQSEPVFTVLLNMIGLNGVVVGTLAMNGSLWTLSYEIWFYISAGALGCLIGRRGLSPWALLVLACSIGVFFVLDIRYLVFWWVGALSVLLVGSTRRRILGAIGLSLFGLGCAAFEWALPSRSFVGPAFLSPAAAEAMISVGLALAIPLLCDAKVNEMLAIAKRPIIYLSSISYTLYLVHFPLNEALGKLFERAADLSLPGLATFGLRAVIVFAIANLFYLAFEANTGALRRYLKGRLRRAAA